MEQLRAILIEGGNTTRFFQWADTVPYGDTVIPCQFSSSESTFKYAMLKPLARAFECSL